MLKTYTALDILPSISTSLMRTIHSTMSTSVTKITFSIGTRSKRSTGVGRAACYTRRMMSTTLHGTRTSMRGQERPVRGPRMKENRGRVGEMEIQRQV